MALMPSTISSSAKRREEGDNVSEEMTASNKAVPLDHGHVAIQKKRERLRSGRGE